VRCYGPRFSENNADVRYSVAFQYDSVEEAVAKYTEFVSDLTNLCNGCVPDKYRIYFGEPTGRETSEGYPDDCDVVINASGHRAYE